jgi:repressor LexA
MDGTMTTMTGLTAKQEQVYSFIVEGKRLNGFPPTVREIAEGIGCSSLNNIRQHLRLIEKKGYIRIVAGKARGIEVKTLFAPVTYDNGVDVPLVGRVAAGTPITAEENIEGTVTLDRTLFKGDGLFTLRVKGDSMKEMGVFDGDIAVVRQKSSASNGEVVVAVIEGEATLKRFFKRDDAIVLHPENQAYEDIVITAPQSVYIAGRLVGVIRRCA